MALSSCSIEGIFAMFKDAFSSPFSRKGSKAKLARFLLKLLIVIVDDVHTKSPRFSLHVSSIQSYYRSNHKILGSSV